MERMLPQKGTKAQERCFTFFAIFAPLCGWIAWFRLVHVSALNSIGIYDFGM
jgi:hypothetical protein